VIPIAGAVVLAILVADALLVVRIAILNGFVVGLAVLQATVVVALGFEAVNAGLAVVLVVIPAAACFCCSSCCCCCNCCQIYYICACS
jgi:hypothetical protein